MGHASTQSTRNETDDGQNQLLPGPEEAPASAAFPAPVRCVRGNAGRLWRLPAFAVLDVSGPRWDVATVPRKMASG